MPSLKQQLDQARDHVATAKQRVADQIALIERLTADGYHPRLAQLLLVTFLSVLETFTQHLAQLESNPRG